MTPPRLWQRLCAFLETEERVALVTVLRAQGSTPREAGTRMLVLPGGRFSGTIGGGALEWQALAAAQRALERGRRGIVQRDFALGPELGQCCGGRVGVAIEIFDSDDRALVRLLAHHEQAGPVVLLSRPLADGGCERRVAEPHEATLLGSAAVALAKDGALIQRFADERTALFLFGAGHVGRALVLALAPLPFRVTWIDPRPAAFPAETPLSGAMCVLADPATALDDAPADSFILVMTHSHALDFDIVARALAAPRFAYVGLIGSATKRARFLGRLRSLGLGDAAAERLVCPIGLTAIRSKLPAAIAAGVAADLLLRREQREAAAADPVEERADG
jgi:xanthine dehydrogenase accessory factor